MLNVTITPHREFLPANAAGQKLFLMLKMRPTKEAASVNPSTAFVLAIDTSGSMDEVVTGDIESTGEITEIDGKSWEIVRGGKTKRDIVIESLSYLLDSGKLRDRDRVGIVQFHDRSSTVIGLTSATEVQSLKNAIAQLKDFSGGTRMGRGMRETLSLLGSQTMTCRRALIFTDGQTFDEDSCRELAREFAANNIPITALGVGDFNEDLLNELSDVTGGRPFHVVAENSGGAAVAITDLPNQIIEEFTIAQQEVINNLALSVKTVQGVKLTRVMRAYPSQAEFSLNEDAVPIGNAVAGDDTIFILEFTIDSRNASRVRIAQLGLTYDIPGQNKRGELPPQNAIVQFMAGESFTAQVDPEVMAYVQQCNIVQMINNATRIADRNPQQAQELLQTAHRITKQIGNETIAQSLTVAQEELRKTRNISAETRKTIKMGAKGKTVKMSQDINDDLSEAEIRKASGT
jgi:Ca-activated chloride channel family protein